MPGRKALMAILTIAAALLVALVAGVPVPVAAAIAAAAFVALLVLASLDYAMSLRAWRAASPRLSRRLPAAFAIGVRKPVHLWIELDRGAASWDCRLYDHADPSLVTDGLPMALTLTSGTRLETRYDVVPTRRGAVTFAPADVAVRSLWGLSELLLQLGSTDERRVYPDFAQVSRYAWLASDSRLQEIGIKTYRQRGQGTDFKQLSEYRIGDSIRQIDWRATHRLGKPIVREYQEERDQRVILLVDCGRRMRADDRSGPIGTRHFDQVLNAVMLLGYVALRQGDAVGAMTFGTPPGQERSVSPRKGAQALNALMGQLFDVEPTPTHSDYVAAAQSLLRNQQKRALVIVITNFRDEDNTELSFALRLLRQRHLVLLASLRERIVDELMAQPLGGDEAAVEIASAHLYEQARRDAFHRLADRDALLVDAEPERLGVALVNQYHAVKRAGLI